ncbi:hypothetical protein EDB86DRAFT_1709842 [Lactarius hatsudake]|nr:hypothetical protein EDB86DRAFT_1709842 [Lactarius hatsudake]
MSPFPLVPLSILILLLETSPTRLQCHCRLPPKLVVGVLAPLCIAVIPDKRPDSRHSNTSRTSTITSRPSSSSFKTGTDGGVVRSKRNFKHLGAVTADPPAIPGIGDLAALLQDAAWLEQRLSDETTTFDIPSFSSEEGLKAESGPASLTATAAKTEQRTQPVPAAATTTRSKGRGLTLGPLTSVSTTNPPRSPVRSSTSTPSLQVHPATSGSPEELSPTPPKSTRGRKYFSLRGALRGSRLSMSSEMSSDDSAPVATPPSPTFDLSMPQSAQGHGNDTMSCSRLPASLASTQCREGQLIRRAPP